MARRNRHRPRSGSLCLLAALTANLAIATPTAANSPQSSSGEAPSEIPFQQSKTTDLAKHHLLPCTKEGEDLNFPIFSVGSEFEGMKQTGLRRLCGSQLPGRTELPLRSNFISFAYGSCRIKPGEESCAIPFQIDNFPACEGAFAGLGSDEIIVRGVPAKFDSLDADLTLYTGTTIVSIHGKNRTEAIRAAKSLRPTSANPWQNPDQEPATEEASPLEPPAAGAMDKTLRCDEVPTSGPSFAPRVSFANGRQHPLVTLELYSPDIAEASFELPAKLRITPRRMRPGRRYGTVDLLTATRTLHSKLILRGSKPKTDNSPVLLAAVRKGRAIAEATLEPAKGRARLSQLPEGTVFFNLELDGSVRKFVTGPGRCKVGKQRKLGFAGQAISSDGSVFKGHRAIGDLCPSSF